jgi:hypothetical protein
MAAWGSVLVVGWDGFGYCSLPTAYCSLLTAHRSLPTAHRSLPTAYCVTD